VLLVFFFIWTWNEFFLPLVFLVSNQNQTVPVALGALKGQHLMNPLTTSAAALLGMFRHCFLPHLPAHPHPRHHRGRGQVRARRAPAAAVETANQ